MKNPLKSKTIGAAALALATNVAAYYGIIIPPEFFDTIAQITAFGLPIVMAGLRFVTKTAVGIVK